MDNFVVRVTLSSSVIATGRLTLDSILAALIYRDTGDIEKAHRDIPLANTDGVWHGSQAFFNFAPIKSISMKRSLLPGEIEEGKFYFESKTKYPYFINQKNLDDRQANWRAEVDSYQVIEATEAVWFGRGKTEQVKQLLTNLHYIGKKGNQGFGQVNNVDILESDDDYSLVYNGQPARPIPTDVWNRLEQRTDHSLIRLEAFKPPYFEAENVECVIPYKRWLPS